MKFVIDGKVYNTETSTLHVSNEWSDGRNMMPSGRATYLYQTKKGAFWAHNATCWQGERDQAEALSKAEAIELYQRLRGNIDDFESIFGEALPEA
jgi:hypothetical protein